jgi:rhamnose transport system permease protein
MGTKTISADSKFASVVRFFTKWEMLLFILLIVINVVNSMLTPFYLSFNGLMGATLSFLDKSFIVFPMAMIILIGEIDISVASTVALSSVIMGVAYNAGNGVSMVVAMLICLGVATLCGFINGLLLTKYRELSPMIITLATATIYRGIAYVILQDRAAGKFPTWFQYFGWGYIGPIPFMLVCFIVCAVLSLFVLNKTTFGRRLYAIGNNRLASSYSGVKVERYRLFLYTFAGFMSGVTAIFLTSRMSSTRPNIALGYELQVISMVVLGGISTAGGKGKLSGAIIAIFIVGFLTYGMGLKNVNSQVLMIIIGLLLVFSVMLPNIFVGRRKRVRQDLVHMLTGR